MESTSRPGAAARAFQCFTGAVHAALPGVLKRIPQTFIGYAVINGSSFLLDIGLLSLLYMHTPLPYPVAVTVGYATACIYSFIINRWLNFRAHGHVGAQSARYTVTMVSNYVIWILGFSWLMEHVGLQFQLARVTAACIEGLYVYVLLRVWVFRGAGTSADQDVAGPVDLSMPDLESPVVLPQAGSRQSTGAAPAASSS